MYEYIPASERKILKTEGVGQINRSLYERIIFIDEGINGEKLGATAYNVIQTEEAQRQLKINKTNNANKRTQALKNLKSVEYVENEQAIQQELLALKQ